MRVGTASKSFNKQPYLKVAVIGASGTGKSEWAARAPRPLIFLTESQGLASIVQSNPDAMVVQIDTWDDFRTAFDAVKIAKSVTVDGQPACETTIGGVTCVFQTLVVDSFTDLQRMAINKLAGVEAGNKDRLDFDGAVVNLSIEKWGQLTSGCEAVWAQQRSIQCNSIFLFVGEDRMDDQSVRMTVPMLSGSKLPYAVGQYFNAVGLSSVRKGADGGMQYIIRWQSATTAAITKPAPGWPSHIVNTREPGRTTLGSLLKHSYPEMTCAAEAHDSAAFVSNATPQPKQTDSQPTQQDGQEAQPTEAVRRRR